MKTFALRTWPNGEFGIGYIRRFTPAGLVDKDEEQGGLAYSWTQSEIKSIKDGIRKYGSPSAYFGVSCPGYWAALIAEIAASNPEQETNRTMVDSEGEGASAALGSSNAANSLTRAQRGSHGLTSYGRRMLRNGCYLMENERRKKNVGMATCTIPTCDRQTERQIVANWSQILKVFLNWLTRRVSTAHPRRAWVLGVTEIQKKRQEKYGGLPLHLHAIFVAKRARGYIVTPKDVQAAWRRAVVSVVSGACNLRWDASTRVEVVRKPLARYLSKYMSKGSEGEMQVAREAGYEPPSSWWFAVGCLKKQIKAMRCYYTDDRAKTIWVLSHSNPEIFEYVHKVAITQSGTEVVIGVAGKMPRSMLNWLEEYG